MTNVRYKRPAEEEQPEDFPSGGRKVVRELFGLFLLFWGLLVLLALLTYSQHDPSLNHVASNPTPVRNAAGVFGAYMAGLLVDVFGCASFVWPVVFLAWGAGCVSSWFTMPWWRWFGFLLLGGCLISLGAALDLGLGDVRGGGMLGKTLYTAFTHWFSPTGSLLIWLFLLFLSLELAFGICWMALLRRGWVYGKAKAAEKDITWARISKTLPELASMLPMRKPRSTDEVIPLLDIHVDSPFPGELPRLSGEPSGDQPTPPPAHQAVYQQKVQTEFLCPTSAMTPVNDAAQPFGASAMTTGGSAADLAAQQRDRDAEAAQQRIREEEALFATSLVPPEVSTPVPASVAPMPHSVSGAQTFPSRSAENIPASLSKSAESTELTDFFGEDRLNVASEGALRAVSSVGAAMGAAVDAIGGVFRRGALVPPVASAPAADIPPAPASPLFHSPASSPSPAGTPPLAPWAQDLRPQSAAPAAPAAPSGAGPVPGPVTHSPAPTPPLDLVAPVLVPSAVPRSAERPRRARDSMPAFNLLQAPQESDVLPPREIMEAKGERLMACLADFGIHGDLVRVTPGPVVTMFEVRPAPGIKVSRIANLNQDMALGLKAEAVRIQAPIPGHDTVGVEIPNDLRSTVNFRNILESDVFASSESFLTMALGKDIGGVPVVADLARMPHLLVAGATGAGKSVCLNALLLSLLFKATPDEVKLLLVDPKRIELAVYADLPHLVHPVVTDMTLAKTALDWAVHEMEERYTFMARLGARNVLGYNKKLLEMGENRPPELADLEPLPYLVIIVDELADLMMTAGKDVETAIVRLAQLARAGGIHLILATQRPSVDVVTGLIKANFPCRIAFQVSNKYDSRTILDSVGAEQLLGRGDMLFKPSGGKLQRLHGPFVSDEDVAAVVEYWKRQRAPEYRVDFSEWGTPQAPEALDLVPGSAGSEEEALYAEVVAFACEEGQKISISKLQRRFRIGFNKAARFMERMEQDGIITPPDRANRPRQVRREEF